MFSHVILGVNDVEGSTRFYDAQLGALGIKHGIHNNNGVVDRYFYRRPTGSCSNTQPLNGSRPA
jgi:catechol 2,3-dioxygenase-like lactoylglutathione lyase family enzyme